MDVNVSLRLQVQSQLIWGIKDKLKKNCSTNDMKELLIANSQEVPSGESNVRRLPLSKCTHHSFLLPPKRLQLHYI